MSYYSIFKKTHYSIQWRTNLGTNLIVSIWRNQTSDLERNGLWGHKSTLPNQAL